MAPIGGEKYWLWRAVDANGEVLDILAQKQSNAKAARRFVQQLVNQFGQPRVVITDKLRSYIKPIKALAPDSDHRARKGLNNRIERFTQSFKSKDFILCCSDPLNPSP